MCTKFYQNRLGFVESMTKTFWCVFSGSHCSLIEYTGLEQIKKESHRGVRLTQVYFLAVVEVLSGSEDQNELVG